MKGSKSQKRYVSILRSSRGKKNGVIPSSGFDDLYIFKLERCKKWRGTRRKPRDGFMGETRAEI